MRRTADPFFGGSIPSLGFGLAVCPPVGPSLDEVRFRSVDAAFPVRHPGVRGPFAETLSPEARHRPRDPGNPIRRFPATREWVKARRVPLSPQQKDTDPPRAPFHDPRRDPAEALRHQKERSRKDSGWYPKCPSPRTHPCASRPVGTFGRREVVRPTEAIEGGRPRANGSLLECANRKLSLQIGAVSQLHQETLLIDQHPEGHLFRRSGDGSLLRVLPEGGLEPLHVDDQEKGLRVRTFVLECGRYSPGIHHGLPQLNRKNPGSVYGLGIPPIPVRKFGFPFLRVRRCRRTRLDDLLDWREEVNDDRGEELGDDAHISEPDRFSLLS
jgi:hypothetical protein